MRLTALLTILLPAVGLAAPLYAQSVQPLAEAQRTGSLASTRGVGFWTNSSPFAGATGNAGVVHRMADRLFIGGSTIESGDFCFPARIGCASKGATNKDWLETTEASRSSPYAFRTSWAQLSALSTNGGIGIIGGARTSDTPSAVGKFQLGIGVLAACLNDNTIVQDLCTAGYDVAFRMPGTGAAEGTGTVGREIDIDNEGNSLQIAPGKLYPAGGFTTALQVNSGALAPLAQTASAAITIGNNGANFYSGIVIGQNALAGLTYNSSGAPVRGGASAIRMGAFQQLEWWNNAGSAPSFVVSSEQTDPTRPASIVANDKGIEVKSSGGLQIPEIAATAASTPVAGEQTIFIDSADHKLKRKDSTGAVTIIG